MDLNSDNYQEIDRYLRDEMNKEERDRFEQQMQENPLLRQELELQRDIEGGVDLFGGESLKKRLQALEGADSPDDTVISPVNGKPKNQRSKSVYLWLGIAASLVLLLMAVILLSDSSRDPQSLYADYYEPYPNVLNPIERSSGAPTEPGDQAMYLYEQRNYRQAIELINDSGLSNDPAYQFYLGICYLEVQDASSAIKTFDKILVNHQGGFYEPALWYRGLAQMQTGQYEAAGKSFREIVDRQGDYRGEAQQILEELGGRE